MCRRELNLNAIDNMASDVSRPAGSPTFLLFAVFIRILGVLHPMSINGPLLTSFINSSATLLWGSQVFWLIFFYISWLLFPVCLE